MGSSIFPVACGIFSHGMQTLTSGVWNLVPWPGIKSGLPALGAPLAFLNFSPLIGQAYSHLELLITDTVCIMGQAYCAVFLTPNY